MSAFALKLAAALVCAVGACAQVAAAKPGSGSPVGVGAGVPGDRFAVGDRLRIVLFEQVGGDAGALSNLLERTEITGEYVVQADGSVYFPLIGAIPFAERSNAEIEKSVTTRLEATLKGSVKLAVQVLEREPIYVVGRGLRSTTLKHSPGMTVMHALALTGNGDASGGDLWRRLDLSREEERVSKIDERLIRLTAKRDILVAEREGADAAPSPSLLMVAGVSRAHRALADEAKLRALELDAHTRRVSELDALEQAVAKEIKMQRSRVEHLDTVLKERAQRLATVREHRRRGLTTESSLQTAVIEADASRERWHEANVILAQTERRLLEVRQESVKAVADHLMEREVRLREVAAAVSEDAVGREKVRPVVMTSGASLGPSHVLVEHFIHRRGGDGLTRLSADATTPLLPGDLLEVQVQGSRYLTMGMTSNRSAVGIE